MYHLPTRKPLSTKLLKTKYELVKKRIMNQLHGTKSINLTVDLWSNRQMKSYLGVTGHFISEFWTLESVMLGCNCVIGRHTAENIVLWYNEITSDFGISNKVKHMAPDSVSNVRKAILTLPGYEDDTKEDSEDMSEDDTDSQDDCELVDISSENDLLEHHSCFTIHYNYWW